MWQFVSAISLQNKIFFFFFSFINFWFLKNSHLMNFYFVWNKCWNLFLFYLSLKIWNVWNILWFILPISFTCMNFLSFFSLVLSKVKEKVVIMLPSWISTEIQIIEETPTSQFSEVSKSFSNYFDYSTFVEIPIKATAIFTS